MHNWSMTRRRFSPTTRRLRRRRSRPRSGRARPLLQAARPQGEGSSGRRPHVHLKRHTSCRWFSYHANGGWCAEVRIGESLEKGGGRGPLGQSPEPAPQLMGSITDIETAGACDTCGARNDRRLRQRAGDNVCGQCDALFTAAHALLDNDIRDEPTILGTLAFAWSRAYAHGFVDPEDYGGLELLSSVDGVPLLRLPRITAGVVTYDGSRIPKAARINVYSRDVKPAGVC